MKLPGIISGVCAAVDGRHSDCMDMPCPNSGTGKLAHHRTVNTATGSEHQIPKAGLLHIILEPQYQQVCEGYLPVLHLGVEL